MKKISERNEETNKKNKCLRQKLLSNKNEKKNK